MSLRNRLVLPVIFSALAMLAGCGGNNVTITPPPSGGFSNSNLNGTYVFSVTGSDSSNGYFQTIAGTFVADGQGNIKSGGFLDYNGATNGVLAAQQITGGRYSVGADGRPGSFGGVITLVTANITVALDYVLTSSQHGLITEYDGNGTGSGTLDAQGNVTQTNIDGQSYAFNFTGTSGLGTTICTVTPGQQISIPLATVGAFTMGGSGTGVTTGVQDFNNDCISAVNLPMTSSAVDLSTVPGTATLATAAGTFNFDVYPVDSTHLKFIEVDTTGSAILSGDAFTQTSSIPSGNNVLTAAGFDSAFGGFSAAGLIVTDSGNITASSVEDINDGGSYTEITSNISGTYSTSLTGGRALLTFTSAFDNGGGTGCTSCQFAAYPSSGGVQLLEIDNAGMTDGTLFAQGNNPSLASAEGYGLNLSGSQLSIGVQEDDIVEFTNNSGTLGPGAIDSNDGGSPSSSNFKIKFQATYAADSTVSGRGTVTPVDNSYALVTYGIDGSNQVVVSSDPNLEGLGFMVEQNATAKSSAATAHLALLRHIPGRSKAMKKPIAR